MSENAEGETIDPAADARLFEPLPMVELETWQRIVESDLGADALAALATERPGGLMVAPLYTERDARHAPLPGEGDYTRGAGQTGNCRVGTLIEAADRSGLESALAAAREGGATLHWLRLAPDLITTPDDLAILGADELRGHALILDAGPATPSVALMAAASLASGAGQEIELSFAVDPLGRALAAGSSPRVQADAEARMVDLAAWCSGSAFGWRTITVDTSAHRAAGAGLVDELAAAVATGIAYLRQLREAGLEPGAAAAQIRFAITVGRELFEELAKLRALRRLWSRVTAFAGHRAPAAIYALSPRHERTVYGTFVNQLRATVEAFVGIVGGADGLILAPFDLAAGTPSALGRRLVRTTQLVAREEAHLGRVLDPAGGSWYVESLTDQLARTAWERVRAIESEGGMAAAIAGTALRQRYRQARADVARAVATRQAAWVGTNIFASLDDAADAAARRIPGSTATSVAFDPHRPTDGFERVRRAIERAARGGARPTAHLLLIGPPTVSRARAAEVARALAAGGFAAETSRLMPSDAWLTVLCGDEAALAENGPAVAERLARAGLTVVVAAPPSAVWKVSENLFLHPGCDLVALLEALTGALAARLEAGDE